MKKIIILSASIFFIIACEKVDVKNFEFNECNGKCVSLNGKIQDGQTKEIINDVSIDVRLYYRDNSISCLGCYDTLIGNITSKNDGTFNLNFSIDSINLDQSYFEITLNKSNYIRQVIRIENKIKLDSTYNLVLNLIPKSTLELSIKNKLSYDTNDELIIGYSIEFDRSSYFDENNSEDLEIENSYSGGLYSSTDGKDSIYKNSYIIPSNSKVGIYSKFYDFSNKAYINLIYDSITVKRFENIVKIYELK